jgi:restriction endonuclease Mrr
MSVSSLPLPHAFFHSILTLLASHPGGIRRRDIYAPVADAMGLSQEEREEQIPSGAGFRYRYRIGWGLHELKAAGYAETPTSGLWRITARGRSLLAANPRKLEEATARGIQKEAHLASRAGRSRSRPVRSSSKPPRSGSTRQ